MNLTKRLWLDFERQASIDRVVTINNIEYELDPIFANKKVKLMATSDYKEIYAINPHTGIKLPVKLLDKNR